MSQFQPFLDRRIIKYSWNDFDSDIKSLALEVALNFKPDLIVGLMRGGMIPAIRLSHLLDVRVEPYTLEEDGEIGGLMGLVGGADKVLVVDEIVDSGKTLASVNHKLKSIGLSDNSYKSASLILDMSSMVYSSYFCRRVNRREEEYWINFPWEQDSFAI
jgi:uncharacterized protein